MDESINGCYGHYAICNDLIPVTKGMIRGDDHAFGLIAVSDKLKEGLYPGFPTSKYALKPYSYND